jgi:glutaredoxin
MTRTRFFFAFLGLALVAGAASAQQLYRWTDEKGGVHVTDTPPPPSARRVEQKKSRSGPAETAAQPPYELAVAMKEFPVVLYTSPGCKEGCDLARSALNKRGVPFREVQVWNDQTNEELKRVSGANDVPTLVVGRSVNRGFEQGAFDTLLDSARYPKAGAAPARSQSAPKPPEGYVAQGEAARAEPPPAAVEEQAPAGPYSPGSKPPPRTPKK